MPNNMLVVLELRNGVPNLKESTRRQDLLSKVLEQGTLNFNLHTNHHGSC